MCIYILSFRQSAVAALPICDADDGFASNVNLVLYAIKMQTNLASRRNAFKHTIMMITAARCHVNTPNALYYSVLTNYIVCQNTNWIHFARQTHRCEFKTYKHTLRKRHLNVDWLRFIRWAVGGTWDEIRRKISLIFYSSDATSFSIGWRQKQKVTVSMCYVSALSSLVWKLRFSRWDRDASSSLF